MTRIAIVGNSHVAALKMGWDLIEKDYPHLDIVFFASVGKAAHDRVLKGKVFGFLNPEPSKHEIIFGNHSERSINLAEFNHVLRVAEPKKESLLSVVLENTVVDGWPKDGREHHMSQSTFEALVDFAAKKQLISPDWCNWTSPKVTSCPAPYPDERCVNHERPTRIARWRVLAKRPAEMLWLREMYIDKHRAWAEKHNIGLLIQPEETIAENGLTKKSYSEGSFRMDANKMETSEEHIHMNAEFGIVMLKKYFKQIDCAAAK
ncbi:MAG TPA: hypothetical protein DIT67_00135 [Octadecabacter sp.]|nr:hypothetical protein [Octadecabacter sp.]